MKTTELGRKILNELYDAAKTFDPDAIEDKRYAHTACDVEEISEALGKSTEAIRGALAQLESDGLVFPEPTRVNNTPIHFLGITPAGVDAAHEEDKPINSTPIPAIHTYRITLIEEDGTLHNNTCHSNSPAQAIKHTVFSFMACATVERIIYDPEGFSMYRIVQPDGRTSPHFVTAQAIRRAPDKDLDENDLWVLQGVANALTAAHSALEHGRTNIVAAAIKGAYDELCAYIDWTPEGGL